MTFSITAHCRRTGRTGIAMATSSPAIGNRCLFVGRDGAVALQSMSDPRRGDFAVRLLASGQTARAVMRSLLQDDYFASQRQIAVVDFDGHAEAHSGEANIPWAGHHVGAGFVAMGNYIAGPQVVQAMAEAFEDSEGQELEDRLMLSLEAARDAGGQEQGQTSAALRTHDPRQGWSRCDLRVDLHDEPIGELRRIHEWYKPFVPYYEERTRTADMPKLRDYLASIGVEREFGKPVPVTWKSRRESRRG